MHEHGGSGEKRNAELEVAAHPDRLYERAGIFCKLNRLSVAQIIKTAMNDAELVWLFF